MFSYDFNLYWQHAVMHVDNFTWIFLKKSGRKNNSSYKQTCKKKKFNEGKKIQLRIKQKIITTSEGAIAH